MPGSPSRRKLIDKAWFRNNGIARRMMIALILFSSAITTVITGVELYLEYRADILDIDEHIESLRKVNLPTLTDERRQELDKVVLSKGAWATLLFRYQQWDAKKNEYSPDRYSIRRYRKVNGEYSQQSKFNISSPDQAQKIVEALQGWL